MRHGQRLCCQQTSNHGSTSLSYGDTVIYFHLAHLNKFCFKQTTTQTITYQLTKNILFVNQIQQNLFLNAQSVIKTFRETTILFLLIAIAIYLDKISENNIRTSSHLRQQLLTTRQRYLIVRIHIADIIARCFGYSYFPSIYQPAIFLMNDTKPMVARRIFLQQITCTVRRTVINAYNLPRLICLSKYTLQTSIQIFLSIIRGDNKRNLWLNFLCQIRLHR
ncbi:hypothetical protein D081_1070 [Anaerovibrio sp. JC8]|nr:hypothetical protein D081_1070 [Anaerovibrio sp. JC8]